MNWRTWQASFRPRSIGSKFETGLPALRWSHRVLISRQDAKFAKKSFTFFLCELCAFARTTGYPVGPPGIINCRCAFRRTIVGQQTTHFLNDVVAHTHTSQSMPQYLHSGFRYCRTEEWQGFVFRGRAIDQSCVPALRCP